MQKSFQESQPISPLSLPQTKNYKQLYQDQHKKVLQLLHQIQLLQIKLKKLVLTKNRGKICTKCINQMNNNNINNSLSITKLVSNINTNNFPIMNSKEEIKKEMLDFSIGIQQKIKKNNQLIIPSKRKEEIQQITTIGSFDLHSKSSKLSMSKKTQLPNIFPMIENFTIFGAPQSSINNQATQIQQGQLLYSYNQPSDVDRQASKLVFPSGLILKKITGQKAKDKAIQMMSFSYTNLKSFILRFKYQDNIDQEQFQKDQFLWHVNPAKSLFCLCIGISDYTAIDNMSSSGFKKIHNPVSLKQLQHQNSQSLSVNQSTQPYNYKQQKQQIPSITLSLPDSMKQTINPNSKQSINSGQVDNTQIYLSQRVFCISSYYPFFTFYQQVLRSLMNIIKMQRLMIYKQCNQNLSQTDSKFQLIRMQQLIKSCIYDINRHTIFFNRTYDLKLMNLQKITLSTDWNLAKTYFVQEWIYAILSMFNIDVFIDIFTLLMLEDKIVFVCNNSHILTYTIYLFTNILIKPLTYAFQVVSIIPVQDFLGAPFPVVNGMLRKRKYVEQSNIMHDYKNTYIFLAPDKADIVYTQNKKQLLKYRPAKLKNDLTNLFKDLKKQRQSNPKTPKYQPQASQYNITSTVEQKNICVQIIQRINQYIFQQIINKMPNHFQIKNLKNSIDVAQLPAEKDQHTIFMEKIKEIVRKNVKDPFANRLLETQMISNLVCK